MKKSILLTILLLASSVAFAQQRTWSVQAGIGGISMQNYNDRGNDLSVGEDVGDEFHLSADYFFTNHLAFTGGISYEHQGFFSDFSSGLGLKKNSMLGVFAGAKYYFLPYSWVVQPYAGASVYTNFLNLGTSSGEKRLVLDSGHPGALCDFKYSVKCPALSLSPKVGVDIHLLSTLSLTLAYEYRYGLWGSSSGTLRYKNGPLVGKVVDVCEKNRRTCLSFGLKLGFPVKSISADAGQNVLMLLYNLFWPDRMYYGY